MGEKAINKVIGIALSALLALVFLMLFRPAYSDPVVYFGFIFLAMVVGALILAWHDRSVSHRARASTPV